jgi:polyphosphate kinase 2 (PPK2 family)
VLVVRVHKLISRDLDLRYRQINDFERMLTENGVPILSSSCGQQAEQARRLNARLRTRPNWKFSPADIEEQALEGLSGGV